MGDGKLTLMVGVCGASEYLEHIKEELFNLTKFIKTGKVPERD